jgi:hypothetical protein
MPWVVTSLATWWNDLRFGDEICDNPFRGYAVQRDRGSRRADFPDKFWRTPSLCRQIASSECHTLNVVDIRRGLID